MGGHRRKVRTGPLRCDPRTLGSAGHRTPQAAAGRFTFHVSDAWQVCSWQHFCDLPRRLPLVRNAGPKRTSAKCCSLKATISGSDARALRQTVMVIFSCVIGQHAPPNNVWVAMLLTHDG